MDRHLSVIYLKQTYHTRLNTFEYLIVYKTTNFRMTNGLLLIDTNTYANV